MQTREAISSPSFTGLWQEGGAEGAIWHAKHNGTWIGSYENLATASKALRRRIAALHITRIRRQLARAAELTSLRIGAE